jgi:TRAP-type C4-dicarboxylate transport system permease small subunit
MLARSINALLRAIDAVVDAIGAVSLLAVTAVVFLNALGRYLFSFAILGAEEFSRLLVVWLCFFGAYVLLRRDAHVSVDILPILLPPRALRVLRGLVGLVALAAMLYLAWYAWKLVGFSARTGQRSTTLPVPRYVFFLPIAIGSSLMAVAAAEKVVRAVLDTLPPLSLPGLDTPTEPK